MMFTTAWAHALPPKRTRLLVVLPSLRGGGVERFTETLLSGLDRGQVSASLGLLSRANEGAHAAGIPSDVPIIDFGKSSALDLPRVVRRMATYMDREKPDVVLGVMTYQNLLLLAASRLSRRRPKVIATEHTNPELLAGSWRRRWQLLMARRLYPSAHAVVCVSDGQREAAIRQFRLDPRRVVRIYNGSEAGPRPNEVGDLPPGWPDSGPVVVFAGHLSEVKGVRYLVDAVAILRQNVPAQLLLLGEGALRPELERRAELLGIGSAVRFLGHVRDPMPYFVAADVVAVPSLSEALSLSLIEAARAGAAIVASDCDYGPREVIDDLESGLLVPPADAPALAAAIERLLSDPVLAMRLRRRALETSERFSPERMVGAYEALILSAGAPARGAGR